jgi:Ran GTPase-activating protein (RanGAP) involved in mRNA processing and transport
MPVMRERALTRPTHFAPDSRGAHATQGAGFKRAADAALPGSASRAKARRQTGQDDIGQALAPPQTVSGLLTLPDDILLTHLPPWLSADSSLAAIRPLVRLRSTCKQLYRRIPEPVDDWTFAFRFHASWNELARILKKKGLKPAQAVDEVRQACDDYREVLIVLREVPEILQDSALAAIAASTGLRALKLDVSNCPGINAKTLCSALQHVPEVVVSLQAKDNHWDEHFLTSLLDTVAQSECIDFLDLSSNNHAPDSCWGKATFKALDRMLRTNSSLETLDLSINRLRDEDINYIAEALALNQGITQLYLGKNLFEREGMRVLGQVLQMHGKVALLDVTGNVSKLKAAGALLEALHENQALTDLKLNGITTVAVPALLELLQHNTTLRTLDVSDIPCRFMRATGTKHQLTGAGADRLLQALCKRPELTSLTMQSVRIRDAAIVARLLCEDARLTHLDLCGSSMNDSDADIIAPALARNTSLRHLGLGNNSFKTEGLAVLAGAVATHPAIESLDLHGVAMTADGVRAVADALLPNHAGLKRMDLSDCTIDNAGAAVLASRLAQNSTLSSLALDDNCIGTKGAGILANALRSRPEALALGIRGNIDINAKAMLALQEVCAQELVQFDA